MKFLSKLAYYLGSSREEKFSWSRPISKKAEVIRKEYKKEEDGDQSFYAVDPILGTSMDDYAPEQHIIEFEVINPFSDNRLTFEEDNKEWFNRYEVGDRVQIIYKQRLKTIRNYKPPNFDEKTITKSKVIKTELDKLIGRPEE